MQINVVSAPEALSNAISDIYSFYPERFAEDGMPVSFSFDTSMLKGANKVTVDDNGAKVVSGGITGSLRALGRIMGAALNDKAESFSETPHMDTIGLMQDCSRNAVMRIPALKDYILRCSLMGINTLMLYTEDTYEVDGEPLMGYLRGGYTKKELKELNDYAADFGVEMLGCIQALAHMEQFLQWGMNTKYRDTNSILCPLDETVYELIEKCIASISSCFKSRRINVGMDEAWGLGTGKFHEKFGDMPTSEIMNKHLARVRTICAKYGLTPMIWSDMYFRIGSKTKSYYDKEWKISPDVVKDIPKDVRLGYWDYYHLDKNDYKTFIEFHRQLGSDPVMVGGIWTWGRLWCGLPYSIKTTTACMTACRETGIRESFMTLWGDDGGECDYDSALAGIQNYAELAYADGELDENLRAANLLGSCDLVFDDMMLSCQIDTNKFFKDSDGHPSSASKPLIWQDPIFTIYEPLTELYPELAAFYDDLYNKLSDASEKTDHSSLLLFPAQIAKILSIKTGMRTRLHNAILADNRDEVSRLLEDEVNPLRCEYESMWELHRDRWMTNNSPCGWEVIESRYATIIFRLDTLADRLTSWLDGEIKSLPELESELINLWPGLFNQIPGDIHARFKTPSCIK